METPARAAWKRFDAVAARGADVMVAAYQRWLSPLKGPGRGCAHRVRYGGESCSQHVRRALAETNALTAAIPLARARFAACRAAAEADAAVAAAAAAPPGAVPIPIRLRHRRRRGQCCIVIPCGTTRTVRV